MLGKTYIWTYDKAGNIRSRETYAYTTGALGSAQRTVSYDYSSGSWGDLLTSYWGNSITYDGVGNPLTWGDYGELTWQGRRLMSYSDSESGDDYSYTYNADGIRTSKTVNGVKHTYHLSGTQILSEEWTEDRVQHILIFVYDDSGQPIGMSHFEDGVKNGDYLFAKNVQGDITAVYDANGTCLVTYTYDAWGNTRVRYSNGGASTAARYNPLRYRGYYYDIETGFYYLNSRYYDPNVGRFLNSDSQIAGVGGDIRGYNLFSYCMNDPVNLRDSNGNWPRWITAAVAVAATVVAVVAVVSAPVVAGVAVAVAVVSTVAYVAQSHHFDKRKEKNVDLPSTPQEAKDAGWLGPDTTPKGPAADCHQYTSPDKSNVKYVSPDGHREVIYNSNGIVFDSRDIGTYNFSPAGTFWGSIGHFFADMLPWYLFGNDDDDPGPLLNEIIRLFK